MPLRLDLRHAFALMIGLGLPATALAQGPYSGGPGTPGSDAIKYTDGRFVEWASGYVNYVQGSPINTGYTDPNQTLGPAKGTTFNVTQLGDGGQITLTFAKPIVSSGGPDFAVFGNSFDGHYLKLAFVDVSQDDVHWFRLLNDSLTKGPVGTFGDTMDPTNIYGLAGKYVVGYGTPFSLSEVGLSSASYVRLTDVIGDGTEKDSFGRPIYDPTPNSNGFNAAGVGVLSDSIPAVPEPTGAILIALGGCALAAYRVIRRRSPAATN